MKQLLAFISALLLSNSAFSQLRIDISTDLGKNEYQKTEINNLSFYLNGRFSSNVSIDAACPIYRFFETDDNKEMLVYIGSGIGYSYLPTDYGYLSHPQINEKGEWITIDGYSWKEDIATIYLPLKFELNYKKIAGIYFGWSRDFVVHKSDLFTTNRKKIRAETPNGFNSFMFGINGILLKRIIVGIGLKKSNGTVMRYYEGDKQMYSLSDKQLFFKIGYRLKG